MRTRALCSCGIALALGLSAGCASDLWYKKGAGTAALAQDKAACSAEVAQLAGAKASEAFEQCMSARDWFHVARGRPGSESRAASTRPREAAPRKAPAAALAAAPAALTPAPVAPAPVDPALAVAPAPRLESPLAPAAATLELVTAPTATPASDALETPPVEAAPALGAAEADEGFEEEEIEGELAPEPIDPGSRQFWFKLGAGPGQLEADQKRCRRELGIADGETEPSRWGQSEDFDACMRGRGWGGGSVSAAPSR